MAPLADRVSGPLNQGMLLSRRAPICFAWPLPTHAGGWCLEWAGDAHKGHPAWLDPAVFVLTAAFDTLDSERAARQPLGLFSRLRAAQAAAAAGDGEGDAAQAQEQGWRGWWKSALRFHGRS